MFLRNIRTRHYFVSRYNNSDFRDCAHVRLLLLPGGQRFFFILDRSLISNVFLVPGRIFSKFRIWKGRNSSFCKSIKLETYSVFMRTFQWRKSNNLKPYNNYTYFDYTDLIEYVSSSTFNAYVLHKCTLSTRQVEIRKLRLGRSTPEWVPVFSLAIRIISRSDGLGANRLRLTASQDPINRERERNA